MAPTALEETAFFTDAQQCGLGDRTRAKLQQEGVATMADTADFKDDDWDTFDTKCQRPGLTQGTAREGLIQQLPFNFSLQAKKRLRVASNLARHYIATGREIEAQMMIHSTVGKVFEIQHEARLSQYKNNDDHEIPKCTATTSEQFIKWLEAFNTWLLLKMGVRKCPLAWITREDAQRPATLPALVAGKPYTEEGGSILGDMILFYDHDHPLYPEDNKAVYAALEEATRGTRWHTSVTTHSRKRDGRAAYTQLSSNHLSDDKWDKMIDDAKAVIDKSWSGNTSITLESHIDNVRKAYQDMSSAAEHVAHQMPDDRTKVKDLLKTLETCENSGVKAAIANIKLPTNNLRDDFEGACKLLIPECPVAKKITVSKKSMRISDTKGVSFDLPKKTPSGLDVRYYKPREWKRFNRDQRDEIDAHRTPEDKARVQQNGYNGGGGNRSNGKRKKTWRHKKSQKSFKSQVSAAVKEQLKNREKEETANKKDLQELAGFVGSLISDAAESKKPSASKMSDKAKGELAMAAAVKINQIVKKSS